MKQRCIIQGCRNWAYCTQEYRGKYACGACAYHCMLTDDAAKADAPGEWMEKIDE